MSAAKLAFLQNFYTDVTLYVPAEPAPVQEVAVAPTAAPEKLTIAQPPAAPIVLSAVPLPLPVAETMPTAPAALPQMSVTLPDPATPPPARPLPPAVAPAAPASAPQPLAPALPPVPAVPPVMLTTFATQGSNAQGVVLLVRLPETQFLKLHRNVFLNKMLQALGLAMGDVVLVNVESHLPVALVNLRRELAATHILAFGKNLLDTTIRNTQIYEPVQFPSIGLAYLSSAEIELVEYDNGLKKRLWAGLQRMFLA